MAFTHNHLRSATEKLGSLDFTSAEIEALASLLTETEADTDDDVTGFGFDPRPENRGSQFMVEISGIVRSPMKPAAIKPEQQGIIIIEEGHCY